MHMRGAALLVVFAALAFAAAAQADCTAPGLRPIHALDFAASGQVRVNGIVTARFPGLGGYFIEAPRADWDGRAETSEALFVYTGGKPSKVVAGDVLVLTGRPQIFHGMPELAHPHVLAHCGRAALPPAVMLDGPLARSGWRGLLGMRVHFAQPLYVTGLDDSGRYGEALLSADGRLFAPTGLTAPGPGAAAITRAENTRTLWLDDGSIHAPRGEVKFADHRFDAAHPLRAGQKLKDLDGIAFFAFKRDMLEPTRFALDRGSNPRRMPDDLHLPTGLRIVSFNVENFFNRALAGPRFPAERGARTRAGFLCQRAKLVAALAALHPALLGLQEIENNGYSAHGALANLVAALDRAVPDAHYRYLRPPTPRLGDDLIAPALVYDARRLTPIGSATVLQSSEAARLAGVAAATGFARPALAARFRVSVSGLIFTAVVVHLRSKRDACGHGFDSGDGAGFCAVARVAAGAALGRWLVARSAASAAANTIILGDFNAYPEERAIRDLEHRGWINLAARYVPVGSRYTESYRGRAGELDYIFASPALARRVSAAAIWHNDADEARAFAYDGRFASCATPWRASDHDPIIAVLHP